MIDCNFFIAEFAWRNDKVCQSVGSWEKIATFATGMDPS